MPNTSHAKSSGPFAESGTGLVLWALHRLLAAYTECTAITIARLFGQMNFRTLTFVAAAILGGFPFFLAWSKRRGHRLFENEAGRVGEWSSSRLLLASFLTLFAELAFIRWIAVEVGVFAYFTNLALLLCFVGFGLGCASAHRVLRWSVGLTAVLGLVLVLLATWNVSGNDFPKPGGGAGRRNLGSRERLELGAFPPGRPGSGNFVSAASIHFRAAGRDRQATTGFGPPSHYRHIPST